MLVIVFLEEINIDHDYTEWMRVSLNPVQFPIETLLEVTAIVQIG